MARPTLLDDEMHQKAQEYITNYSEHDHPLPSVVGMAVVLGVTSKTLYNWANDESTGFLHTLDQCSDAQHFKLLCEGLTGGFNPTIVKLALSNHGYSEKTSTDLTSGGQPIKNDWHIHPTTVKE